MLNITCCICSSWSWSLLSLKLYGPVNHWYINTTEYHRETACKPLVSLCHLTHLRTEHHWVLASCSFCLVSHYHFWIRPLGKEVNGASLSLCSSQIFSFVITETYKCSNFWFIILMGVSFNFSYIPFSPLHIIERKEQ